MQKYCTGCSLSKLSDEFWKNKSQSDGLDNLCISCRKNSITQYRKKLKDNRPIKVDDNDTLQAKKIEQKNKKKFRELFSRYGLTKNKYLEMLDSQSNCCKMCDERTDLVVDHCHTSGLIRGLLCGRCNLALGYLRDSEELALRAANYLKSNKVE